MKTPTLAALLAVPAIVAAVPAQAQPAQPMYRMIVRKLGLTQAQQAAAGQVLQAHRASLRAEREAAFQARADLLQALADPQTTQAQIQGLEGKASAARLALELEFNAVVKEIAPSLTPDQLAQLKQLAAEARARVESWRQWLDADGSQSGAPQS